MRHDGRSVTQLRPIEVRRGFTGAAAGSVYIKAGRTTILCTADIEPGVPPWRIAKEGDPQLGWLTAEYNMLPGSTRPRKRRDRNKVDGRTTEIQRLIGRSLRAVMNDELLGAHTITVDCDVLEADGGTRTLSITGGYLALCDAVASLGLEKSVDCAVAAVSVGIVGGTPVLDLDYVEDSTADVDMNVVMTSRGDFIEVQGTAEGVAFSREQLNQQLDLAEAGIRELFGIQASALAENADQLLNQPFPN